MGGEVPGAGGMVRVSRVGTCGLGERETWERTLGGGYASLSGTSMATPLVAGQAALIRSHNPALSNAQVGAVIVDTADPYTPYAGRTTSGGRVNVLRALQAATPVSAIAPAAPGNLVGRAVSRNQVNLTWTDNAANETGFYVERSMNGTNYAVIATLGANATGYANTGLNRNTLYYYRVRAFNAVGESAYTAAVGTRTRK